MEINNVAETDNDKLVFNTANNAHPPHGAMPSTTTTAYEEGGDDDDVGAKDGDDNDEADGTKGGVGVRGNLAVKYGNKDGIKEDVMGILPLVVACRVERLKCLNTERERVMEQYLEERAALEMKYSDLCKPLHKERGNVVAGRLDDKTEMIHKEGGGKEGGGGVEGRQRRRRQQRGGERGEGGGHIPGGRL